jgi:hypothetical protein
MADFQKDKRTETRGRKRKFSKEEAKDRKRVYDQGRKKSSVNIGAQVDRWNALKESLKLTRNDTLGWQRFSLTGETKRKTALNVLFTSLYSAILLFAIQSTKAPKMVELGTMASFWLYSYSYPSRKVITLVYFCYFLPISSYSLL